MEAFGRIISIIAAVILLVMLPIAFITGGSEKIKSKYSEEQVDAFVDSVRKDRQFTVEEYELFREKLAATGMLFDIDITVSRKKESNNYEVNKSDAVAADAQKLSIMLTAQYEEMLTVAAEHIHTTNCYIGHNHTLSGCTYHTHSLSCYTTTTSYYDYACSACGGDGLVTCTGSTTTTSTYYSYGATKCPIHGDFPAADVYVTKCNVCGTVISVVKHWYCSVLGTQTTTSNPHAQISCTVCGGDGRLTGTTTSQTLICGRVSGWSCGYSSEDTTPDCAAVVTSLEPENSEQNIMVGKSINAAAFATFLDGHTETVTCSVSGFNNTYTGGAQTVTLSYGSYSNTAKNAVPYKVTISATVTTDFALTVTSGNDILGTVNGSSGLIKYGTSCTVNAVPIGDNQFIGWFDDNGVNVAASKTYTFNMPASDYSLTAMFQTVPDALDVVPNSYSVLNGDEPAYNVTVKYTDGSSDALPSDSYTKTGFTRGAGEKTVIFTYTEYGVTVTRSINITVNRNTTTCDYGHIYELDDFNNDGGCPICEDTVKNLQVTPEEQTVIFGGDEPSITVKAVYLDGHSAIVDKGDWTWNYDSTINGSQFVTVMYKERTAVIKIISTFSYHCDVCDNDYPAKADGTDGGCPYCKADVVSVSASPEYQAVDIGSAIELTVTAAYRNGDSEEVTGYTTSYQPYVEGEQNVVVSYGGCTCSIIVKVTDNLASCPNCGLEYDPNEYFGCPVCYEILNGIMARTRDGSETVEYGSSLDLIVTAVFLDGHREILASGYQVTGFWPYQAGIQTVMIEYGGFADVLTITVSESDAVDGSNAGNDGSGQGGSAGSNESANDYDNDQNVYFEVTYMDSILEVLYSAGVYELKPGDSITISISLREREHTGILFYMTDAWKEKKYIYGGLVY